MEILKQAVLPWNGMVRSKEKYLLHEADGTKCAFVKPKKKDKFQKLPNVFKC